MDAFAVKGRRMRTSGARERGGESRDDRGLGGDPDIARGLGVPSGASRAMRTGGDAGDRGER